MPPERDGSRPTENLRPYLPTAIVVVALLVGMALQTTSAIGDRQRLNAARSAQEQSFQQATNLRKRLDAIAGDAALLAIDGDPAARVIREDLRRMGIVLPAPTPK